MSDKKAAAPKRSAAAKKKAASKKNTASKKPAPKKHPKRPQRPPKDTKKYANDWNFEQMFGTLQNSIGTLCNGMASLTDMSRRSDPYVDFKAVGLLQSALEVQLHALHNLTEKFYDTTPKADPDPVPNLETPNPGFDTADTMAALVGIDTETTGLAPGLCPAAPVFTPPGGKDGD